MNDNIICSKCAKTLNETEIYSINNELFCRECYKTTLNYIKVQKYLSEKKQKGLKELEKNKSAEVEKKPVTKKRTTRKKKQSNTPQSDTSNQPKILEAVFEIEKK